MPLSLHQQAHYVLSEVTAVIEAILLTRLSLLSSVFVFPFFSVLIGANYKESGSKAPSQVPGEPLDQLSGSKSAGIIPLPLSDKGETGSCAAKCRIWVINPCALFRVQLLLFSCETQSPDCSDKSPRVLTFQFFLIFAPVLASVHFGGEPRRWVGVVQAYAEPWLSWCSCLSCGGEAAAVGGWVPALGTGRSPCALIRTPGRPCTGTNAAGYGTSSSFWRSTQETNLFTSARWVIRNTGYQSLTV